MTTKTQKPSPKYKLGDKVWTIEWKNCTPHIRKDEIIQTRKYDDNIITYETNMRSLIFQTKEDAIKGLIKELKENLKIKKETRAFHIKNDSIELINITKLIKQYTNLFAKTLKHKA